MEICRKTAVIAAVGLFVGVAYADVTPTAPTTKIEAASGEVKWTEATWTNGAPTETSVVGFEGTTLDLLFDAKNESSDKTKATRNFNNIYIGSGQTLNLTVADGAEMRIYDRNNAFTGAGKANSVLNIDTTQNPKGGIVARLSATNPDDASGNSGINIRYLTANILGKDAVYNEGEIDFAASCAGANQLFGSTVSTRDAAMIIVSSDVNIKGFVKNWGVNRCNGSLNVLENSGFYATGNFNAWDPCNVNIAKNAVIWTDGGFNASGSGANGKLTSSGLIQTDGAIVASGIERYNVTWATATFNAGAKINQTASTTIDETKTGAVGSYLQKGTTTLNAGIAADSFDFANRIFLGDGSNLVLKSSNVFSIGGKKQGASEFFVAGWTFATEGGKTLWAGFTAANTTINNAVDNEFGTFKFFTGSTLTLQLDASKTLAIRNMVLMTAEETSMGFATGTQAAASGDMNVYLSLDDLGGKTLFFGEDIVSAIRNNTIHLFDSTNKTWEFIEGEDYKFVDGDYTFADGTVVSGAYVVPEPATYAAIFGALALGFVAWRRRK